MYPSPSSADRSEDESLRSRQRTARACDSCYKRKIKCDAAIPQCNWCSHHSIPCTFTRVTQRRRKEKGNGNSQQKNLQLAERIDRIEKLLTDNLLKESSSPNASPVQTPIPPPLRLGLPMDSPPVGSSSVSSSMPLHFAGRELGPVSLITGIPFLSHSGRQWVQSRTGQQIAFDKLSPTRPPWEKQRAQTSNAMLMNSQCQKIFELPDRKLVERNSELYHSSLIQRIFPVIDVVIFKETIKAAYDLPHPDSPVPSSTRACIFAFLAFATLIHHPCMKEGLDGIETIDGESYVLKVQHLVPQLVQEPVTLESLQAVTMLAIYELFSGNLQSASYYGSLSTAMIFTLGANTFSFQPTAFPHSSEAMNYRGHGHLRNLFWLCYTIEKDICLRTGQPQLFTEENCDLTLPPGYVEKLYTSMAFHHNSQELPEDPLFPVDLRLSIIKSRAYSALYSFKALQKSDAELLKAIRELDDELERWRMSVPLEWRPTLSFSHETPDPNVSMHSVMLRLNYHLCMTIIHLASSRCKSWANGEAGMMDGVSSSLALSVEASRSTLLYLEASEHVLVDGIFWTIIFYPMSALMAIFCNIIQNPSDPQAAKDLNLLKLATTMTERVFIGRSLSVTEIVHIKMVANFVTELYRLASCAIEKAWSERSR